jgi:hypothetical protein
MPPVEEMRADSVDNGAGAPAGGDYVTPEAFVGEGPSPSTAADLYGEALETVFYDWWADNHEALSLGASGDVADLRLRLNAAFANSLHSRSVKPSAR